MVHIGKSGVLLSHSNIYSTCNSQHKVERAELTVWDRVCCVFMADEACLGPWSRMVEWCGSPGRPPLRLCPIQSGTRLSVGCREKSTQVRVEKTNLI